MGSKEITYENVVTLEQEYARVKVNVKHCRVANGYPLYPEVITTFMRTLSGHPWGNRDYGPRATNSLIEQLDDATLVDCQSIFTACSRGERYANGHWIGVLESGLIDRVIGRMKSLLQESKTELS